jgi:hypothetical protein
MSMSKQEFSRLDASLEHAGAAGGVLHAPILGIEPGADRCFGPRFGLVAHHHGYLNMDDLRDPSFLIE